MSYMDELRRIGDSSLSSDSSFGWGSDVSSRSLGFEDADLPQPLTRMCLYRIDELQNRWIYSWKAYLQSIFP